MAPRWVSCSLDVRRSTTEETDLDNEESTIIDTLEQQLENFEQEPDRDAIVAALT